MPKKVVQPQAEITPVVFTVREVAKYLNVPMCSAYLLIRRGQLRYLKIGKRFVVPVEDVKTFLEKGLKREGVAA